MTAGSADPKSQTVGNATVENDAHAGTVQEKIVTSLFSIFMGRAPGPNEMTAIARLIVDLDSLPAVLERFANTDEFKNRKSPAAQQKSTVPIFAPAGHFYSPVVDPTTLTSTITPSRQRREPETLVGLDLDIAKMTQFWRDDLLPYAKDIPFADEPDGHHRYHYKNPAFSYGDGTVLYALLRRFKPKRVIEVGSGYSSACLLDASSGPGGFPCEITFIEPHPTLLKSLIREDDIQRVTILEQGIQSVPLSCFETLEEGDFLFIDSTHVLKTGSDVAFELAEVLPLIKPGVFIHFHDIFYPFEYSHSWAVAENRSWNEIYGLRAFLAFNKEFEVVFFNDMFLQLRVDVIKADCPSFLKNSGGSIWLRRRGVSDGTR
ncbi:class I SAM-dependent methyltransferase [Methylobacterium sp. Leaf399]|uniref:class I SAM-dependent methyltransferase n=1 Tax=Methylobacterium sp. Leaf399 TaxID=1736364 RepID=UPI0012E3BBEB|nr:class I SAM-dependent methyltransferase [Methylobacterium sp. Leaf399]